jgi:Holliday junction DNA helicase RuvA
MIHFLRGRLAGKLDDSVVIDTGGIGWRVFVPSGSRLYLAAEGEEVTVHTMLSVKEDDMSLYGFDEEAGLELFRKLITVNGVGAKAAMAILSSMPVSELKKAIVYEDVAMLTRANGVGKKTAQRIVLDLKDKLDDVLPAESAAPAAAGGTMASTAEGPRAEAIDALEALGYTRSEAAAAVTGLGEDLSAEDYIKQALQNM